MGGTALLFLLHVIDTDAKAASVSKIIPDRVVHVPDHADEIIDPGIPGSNDDMLKYRSVCNRQHHLRARCRQRTHSRPFTCC